MKKKILTILLSALSIASVAFSGCSQKAAPDYSDSKLQYDFYGYSALIDGWNIDGVPYDSGEDYLTVDRIKEYKDAGMTIYFPQSAAAVTDSVALNFENSEAKKALDYSLEAGIDKVILMDTRIQALSKPDKTNAVGLIGEGKQFATEADLDAAIASYLEPYKDHEAFFGVMLGDEPFYYHAENYGQVYRSIKRVMPECYIQYNLNPITAGTGTMKDESGATVDCIDVRFPELKEGDEGYGEELSEDDELIARYRAYLRLFMDNTGADYIQYDQYPFRHADKVDEYYFLGLQVVAELAKEYDAEFYFVTQTYGQTDGVSNPRMLEEADLYWLNNSLLGFGIKQISYFTYFTKADNNREHFIDGNSFLTWYGEKTDIYYTMQQIMQEEQKLAPTILSFEYTTSKIYTKNPTVFNSVYAMRTLDTADFKALKEVSINKEIALVTELYDDDKQNYMYMVQNIVDSANKGSKAFQTTVLTFGEEYTHALVFVKGEQSVKELEEGTLTLKHKSGEATFVIPY